MVITTEPVTIAVTVGRRGVEMALTAVAAQKARIAFQRFGLGAKPGGPSRIGLDPVAAVKAELENPAAALITDSTLPTYATAASRSQLSFEDAHNFYLAELKARVKKHQEPEVGFVERLVLFWSNHFSMSINKGEAVRGMIGQVERDVIRKNVLGSFQTMLRGVIKHPAMIQYLDNADSIGPKSTIGLAWGVGLNENLAREILELHTLGSGGGYTENDVTQLARVITGWSYVRGWEAQYGYNGGTPANRGRFIFRADWHEPGTITVLGTPYAPEGLLQGDKVLNALVRKRATAEHIAYKLVAHFITDAPTPTMVKPVADAFFNTAGNLKATALALLNLPEAWTLPLGKIRTPYELSIAQFRALGRIYGNDDSWAFSEPLRALRNLPWERATPDGYPDETAHWLDPDGMTIRLDTAMLAVQMFGGAVTRTPLQMGTALFDTALSAASRAKLTAATSKVAGLSILFMSPEFQRR
jgi:uncharacterized protein (DUF1800 family)